VSFLLDTNILSAHLRRPAGLAHRFFQHSGRLFTSGVSLAELYDWVNGRSDPDPLRASVQMLLTYEVSLIPFDADCAEEFGRVRADLRRQGISVDNYAERLGASHFSLHRRTGGFKRLQLDGVQEVKGHRAIEEPVGVIPGCNTDDRGSASDHAQLRMAHFIGVALGQGDSERNEGLTAEGGCDLLRGHGLLSPRRACTKSR
jgi:tRNA(fMet)-specific endonuclease VapC